MLAFDRGLPVGQPFVLGSHKVEHYFHRRNGAANLGLSGSISNRGVWVPWGGAAGTVILVDIGASSQAVTRMLQVTGTSSDSAFNYEHGALTFTATSGNNSGKELWITDRSQPRDDMLIVWHGYVPPGNLPERRFDFHCGTPGDFTNLRTRMSLDTDGTFDIAINNVYPWSGSTLMDWRSPRGEIVIAVGWKNNNTAWIARNGVLVGGPTSFSGTTNYTGFTYQKIHGFQYESGSNLNNIWTYSIGYYAVPSDLVSGDLVTWASMDPYGILMGREYPV